MTRRAQRRDDLRRRRELDTSRCELVCDPFLIRTLKEMKAPLMPAPGGGSPTYYAQITDVQAARTLLVLSTDERLTELAAKLGFGVRLSHLNLEALEVASDGKISGVIAAGWWPLTNPGATSSS